MKNKIYWHFRRIMQTIVFGIKRICNNIFVFFNTRQPLVRVQKVLFIEVCKQVLFNIVICFLLFKADSIIGNKILIKIVEKPFEIDGDLVSDMLIGMIGIAGVLLGLYCSYIVSVFSAKYADAPKQISSLFENDMITNKSVKSISTYIIFSIIVLLINICGYNIGICTISYNVFLALKMIVSYIHIGKRIFRMSDICFIADSIYYNILRHFRKVSKIKFSFNDTSFQQHSKKTVHDNIQHLYSLNVYNINSNNNKSQSIYEFMCNNLKLIKEYLSVKQNIPHDSYWFKRQGHKKWYNASDREIYDALENGKYLKETLIIDHYWLEESIFKINDECLDNLFSSNSINLIDEYISYLNNIISTIVIPNDLQFVSEYVNSIQGKLVSLFGNGKKCSYIELAVVEELLISYIGIVVSISKYLRSIDIDGYFNRIVKHKYRIHRDDVRYLNYNDIRKILDGIDVEIKVEGRIITPDWFIKQYIAKHMYDDLVCCCVIIDNIVNRYFVDFSEKLFEAKEYSCVTLVYSRAVELKHKVQIVLPEIKELLTKLQEYHIETNDFVWEYYDIDNLYNKLKDTYDDLPIKWSKSAAEFALEKWEDYDKYPDMLGLCYNHMCDYLIQSIVNNDFDAFAKTYDSFLKIVILYQELSKKDLKEIKEPFKQDMVLSILCNPILDFGYISGYAYIWGEICGQTCWKETVDSKFANILNKNNAKKENFCMQISKLLSVPKVLRPGVIYNRSFIHMNWKRAIEKSILGSGYLKWEIQGFTAKLQTQSELLRELIKERDSVDLMYAESYEVFATFVLNKYLPDDQKYQGTWNFEKRKQRRSHEE